MAGIPGEKKKKAPDSAPLWTTLLLTDITSPHTEVRTLDYFWVLFVLADVSDLGAHG